MSHFAKLDENNIVTFVTVGRQEDDGLEAELTARTGDVYKQTSYNTYGGVHYTDGLPSDDQNKALRFNYAGIGYTFDPDKGTDGAFIPPKPFQSWILNEDSCLWEPPEEYPGGDYYWNEETTSWVRGSQPYDSWGWNNNSNLWEAPVPYPTDGNVYTWDEDAGDWVEVTDETF